MYNSKQIQFVGKHDYEKSKLEGCNTFSIGVFQWLLKNNKKEMKKSNSLVRIKGFGENPDDVYDTAEEIIKQLDSGNYSGKKNVNVQKQEECE